MTPPRGVVMLVAEVQHMDKIFSSRAFWVALVTILVVIVSAFIPGFALDAEHAGGLAAVAAGYLVAYAIAPSAPGVAAMLTSRKFWTALIGFVIVLLDAFKVFPYQINVADMVGFLVVVIAYLITLSLDPGAGWRGLFVSRKFWTAFIGLVYTLLKGFGVSLTLTPDQVLSIAVVLAGYIAHAGFQGSVAELPEPEINDEGAPE